MGMTLIDPGMLSTIQDEGRKGYMEAGFSPSGAMDGFSFALANALVNNPAGEAVLEMTFSGASFLFDGTAALCVTGADMKPLLNGNPIAMNKAFCVRKGDIFCTGMAIKGFRSYIAVSGGFAIEPVMGSFSTNLKARIGGFNGRKLESKDHIPFRKTINSLPGLERRLFNAESSPFPIAAYTAELPLVLHVVEGSQLSYFTREGMENFYASIYTVTSDSDRMGVRLEGPAISSIKGTDIVSDGIALGSIQVPGSGKPIILLNDRQTTGGYAKIGAVITRDIWRLSQAVPGSQVRFEKISLRDAEKCYRQTVKAIKGLQFYR
ncbi:biotin-dependent carboxyltransferase family protein [Leadbettera azotonutricia]|uniref:Allophanate hydrolase subunit 2 n=1 Tax=Leadbettera azotonutricia (strain ATCC BAA-888 / DSM 13862 / ZAS-9) TaxID=545695 RepID=F5YAA8_LEAAZ|nr:biotin-dependent carboxyltransferase family protein [Leadbettera azotonutricia]AEF81378.1 allophanate hydrolase subunit 2 [Leadbettera azotonutricia ZAS-9]